MARGELPFLRHRPMTSAHEAREARECCDPPCPAACVYDTAVGRLGRQRIEPASSVPAACVGGGWFSGVCIATRDDQADFEVWGPEWQGPGDCWVWLPVFDADAVGQALVEQSGDW